LDHRYQDAKAALEERQKQANEATYARTKAEQIEAAAVLAQFTAITTAAQAVLDAAEKGVTTAKAAFETATNNWNALSS
jgi:hypothetical protein